MDAKYFAKILMALWCLISHQARQAWREKPDDEKCEVELQQAMSSLLQACPPTDKKKNLLQVRTVRLDIVHMKGLIHSHSLNYPSRLCRS